MKNLVRYLPFLALSLLAAQCEKDEVAPGLGSAFTVGPDQTVQVTDDVRLTLTKLHDSRCPKDAQCVWAGYADARIKLTAKGASAETTLCLGDCRNRLAEPYKTEDATTLTVGGESYLVALKAIREPGKPTDATFVVTRK